MSSISSVRRFLRRGDFQLMSQLSSLRFVRFGVVQLKRLSGMMSDPCVGDICDKKRDSRVGADDESRASALSKYPDPLRLRWQVWEIWASTCLAKCSTCVGIHMVTSASKCKGAIFARASISAMPADVSLVKLMWLQKRGWSSAASRHRRQTCATRIHAK